MNKSPAPDPAASTPRRAIVASYAARARGAGFQTPLSALSRARSPVTGTSRRRIGRPSLLGGS